MDSPENISDLNGRRILVVDDDAMSRFAVNRFLEMRNFRVSEAESGEEALQRVPLENPDLVLMDVHMGGMSGFEACRQLKEKPYGIDLPIIFLSAATENKEVLEGFEAGGSDYITKPFNPDEAVARIRTHLQLRLLLQSQRGYIDALREAEQTRTKFLGFISHDLKNPLVSIRGLSDFLLKGAVGEINPEQREMIQSMETAAANMLEMVMEILDFSRAASGQLTLECQPTDLDQMVSACVTLHRAYASDKGIRLVYESQLPWMEMEIDDVKIRRVIDNLLNNAIKFSSDGMIRVVLREDGQDILVEVEDEGPGIPEKEMNRLFQDFGTTSVKPTAGESSTGFGLATCKRIVEAHGGTIFATNRRERGARFTVALKKESVCLQKV